MSAENVARIKRQNEKKISVIIGNPPYNANQLNENENNKNREYSEIDHRIRESYIKSSTAHKTKLYDMYARFFRWASDRVDENGIIAFITNRSFIDKRGFDGFRNVVAKEFSSIYVVDLGGDWKGQGIAGGGNVFKIGTGVAISFLVRRSNSKVCEIKYYGTPQTMSGEDKLSFLSSTPISEVEFEIIQPDSGHNWINQADTDFGTLMPLVLPKLSGKQGSRDLAAIFTMFTHGCVSNRDDWVYANSESELATKIKEYIKIFNQTQDAMPRPLPNDWESRLDYAIKWTQDARRSLELGSHLIFRKKAIRQSLYRPFVKRSFYYSADLNWSLYRMDRAFSYDHAPNTAIVFSDPTSQKPFMALSTSEVFDLHLVGAASGAIGLPRSFVGTKGSRGDNITDWALNSFREHYGKDKEMRAVVTKDAIFHYVYSVLHDPLYREKYSVDLKRELPRIPLYSDFWKWSKWGERLLALHTDYQRVIPWQLKRQDTHDAKAKNAGLPPKVILKAKVDAGTIQIDSETALANVPPEAWNYTLGNRSALDWILDQYKEKTPKDPTIREKFNTYRFADHKEHVIELLMRVTRVSVETMEIVSAMSAVKNR